MKWKPILLLATALALAGCSGKQTTGAPAEEPEEVSIALQLSKQSRLYTAEYVVHKIVTHEDLKQLRGSLFGIDFKQRLSIGDRKIAIPIDVTLQAYIDLGLMREDNIERQGDVLHITLPDPKIVVTSSKVDNRGIRTHVSFFRSNFKDEELTDFTRQGVASVVSTVPKMGIIESARQNAASLLIPLLVDMGYREENIVVTFRKDFEERDLRDLFDNEHSTVKLNLKTL